MGCLKHPISIRQKLVDVREATGFSIDSLTVGDFVVRIVPTRAGAFWMVR